MTKEKIKNTIICTISLILFVLISIYAGANRITENTDIIMPSIYIVDGISIWYVMLLTVIAEAVIIKLFLKESYFKSGSIALLINAISTALGFVTIHLANLTVELLFVPFDLFTNISIGTFHFVRWIFDFLAIILMNSAIEGLIAKTAFKYRFKKTFSVFFVANAVSILICILCNLYWVQHMFF